VHFRVECDLSVVCASPRVEWVMLGRTRGLGEKRCFMPELCLREHTRTQDFSLGSGSVSASTGMSPG
jgi:hypothetical protein